MKKEQSIEVEIKSKHEECCGGKFGSKKGTLIAKGWHSNYSDFSQTVDGIEIKGVATYVGSTMIVEIGNDYRWQIDLSSIINGLAEQAFNDIKEGKKK